MRQGNRGRELGALLQDSEQQSPPQRRDPAPTKVPGLPGWGHKGLLVSPPCDAHGRTGSLLPAGGTERRRAGFPNAAPGLFLKIYYSVAT